MKTLLSFLFLCYFSTSAFSQNWKAERDFLGYKVFPINFSDSLYKLRARNTHMHERMTDGRTFYQSIRLRDFPHFRPDYGRRTETWESLTSFANKFMSDPDTTEYQVSDWIYIGSLFFYEGIHKSQLREAQRTCFRKAYLCLTKPGASIEDHLLVLLATKANGDTIYSNALVRAFEYHTTSPKWGQWCLMMPELLVPGIPYVVGDSKFNQLFDSFTTILLDEMVKAKENALLTVELLDESLGFCRELSKSKRLSDEHKRELKEISEALVVAKAYLNGDILPQASLETSSAPTALKDGYEKYCIKKANPFIFGLAFFICI